MTVQLRDFMWQHKAELDNINPNWDMIFKDAHEELDPEFVKEFVNLLSNSKAKNLDIDIVKRTCILQELLNQINYALENPGVMQDSSNGWSRFDSAWMSLETYDYSSKDFLDFLIKSGHQYGLNLSKLEYRYSYWGDETDWDLGWFDKKQYRRLHPEIFK